MTNTREEVAEIVPCPYVNGFGSDNNEVSFILKKYDEYSDFIIFDSGKPSRCFRFKADNNSKYVAGLVEALKHYATQGDFIRQGIVCNDEGRAKHALSQLPEELRG